MIIFYAYKVDDNLAYLDGDESRHCMKVLRKRSGGVVKFTDGNGRLYSGTILSSNREVVLNKLEILEENKVNGRIIVAISPTKNLSRFEWFVEKGVEIGVTDIIPLICKRSEKQSIKEERTMKIIRSAAKQSLNLCHPKLHDLMNVVELTNHFSELNFNKFIASFDENNEHLFTIEHKYGDSIIMIGPEGDFAEEELKLSIENGYRKVNISASRLRTETAGIVSGEILCLKKELK